MRHSKKGQAALEYMVTYGWALLAAVIAAGALAYFGFISPSNLLPNTCNFGKQLYCEEYQVFDNGTVNILFRNNFAKPIQVNEFVYLSENGDAASVLLNGPVDIPIGSTGQVSLVMDSQYWSNEGQKQSLNLQVNFTRTDIASVNHTIYGKMFTTVGQS